MNRFARPVTPQNAPEDVQEIDLSALAEAIPALKAAPVSVLILAEMLARDAADPEAAIRAMLERRGDLAFRPARVLMQDYAGLPALLDIAALRGEVAAAGGDPLSVGLSRPVQLVIDHSVMVMQTGAGAEAANLDHEYANNAERFAFLKWAEQAFDGLTVVPPGQGIVHQMNLERFSEPARLARDEKGAQWIIPDSLVGTDSHSTMCGGLGILGWGVGGIEATAVLLGLPVAIPAPVVTGVRLTGTPAPGIQATDIALNLTRFLRELGVVGEIVEFHGPGLSALSVADRALIANMAPEYGATAGFFPADAATVDFLKGLGRLEAADRLQAWLERQPLLSQKREVRYHREVSFDLSAIGQTIAGPKLPHQTTTSAAIAARYGAAPQVDGLQDGDIVLAAITSCTITSNPRAMVTAGLVARKALAHGLRLPERVKASFSPGSRRVSAYLRELGLLADLEKLGFAIAGYGCMTCVGNSGELNPALEGEIRAKGLKVAAVLSGNRNFEARIHPAIAENFLMSPARVIAQALLGHMRADLDTADLGGGLRLADIWPDEAEIAAALAHVDMAGAASLPKEVTARWEALPAASGPVFYWPENSSFFRPPEPGFPGPAAQVLDPAVPLLVLGDAITTDHISPVGRIAQDSPAGRRLAELGIPPEAFGAYGARRGNPELMRMGTFANPRLENALATRPGWFTRYPGEEQDDTIEAVAARLRAEGRGSVIVAGQNYGIGSARDWAAKGTAALGVRAVIAQSFERIHRTNLALVGVLPLQIEALPDLDLRHCWVAIETPATALLPAADLELIFGTNAGQVAKVNVKLRLDTEFEVACWRAGGMLQLARRGR